MLTKKEQRLRRARQTRIRIAQQGAVRLTVNRTNLHIYANVISGDGSKVLASASTVEAEVRKELGASGKGGNAAISPEQIAAVLGSGPIADFAKKLGVSPEQASETLAGLLPEAIDRLTPNGTAEGADDLLGGLMNNLPGGLSDALGGLFKR